MEVFLTYRVYGISTCDTVRKACKWLNEKGLEVERVDFRKDPPSAKQVSRWVEHFGSKALRNTSGGSYRSLPAEKTQWSEEAWIEAFASDPMLIKRPVIERDGEALQVGFRGSEEEITTRLIG